MSIQPSRNYNRNTDPDCKEPENDCGKKKNPTQITINRERVKICDLLYGSAGTTKQLQKKFDGANAVYNDKKCLFVKTEGNYQRYRNLEITVGTELLQTNDSVKANVASYSKLNKDLGAILKNIAKSVKDVRNKFEDLSDVACKLGRCKKDSCNTAQWKALTGISPNCPKEDPSEACEDADKIFSELICKPNGLLLDIDSIFKSAHDVMGIQLFSNIDSLDPMQKTLEEKGKVFEKHISETMKLRDGDLKKLQDELVKSVQEITKAAVERNFERSNFEGYKDAAGFLCCPDCGCTVVPQDIHGDSGDDWTQRCDKLSKPILEACEKEICDICEDVQKAFCCRPVVPDDTREAHAH